MILGMDFSSLEETERKGGVFRADGRQVDLVRYLAELGISSARLRLWHDPYGEDGTPYEGGTCDIRCLERLARRARDAGMGLLLDLHYSDFWCDPSRQLPPKAWRGAGPERLAELVYEYTARVLQRLREAGLEPSVVQVGNEITNGFLWPHGRLTDHSPREGFDSLALLLKAGTRAVRDNSGAGVMLHLERSGNAELWREWLDSVTGRDVDFDIIGASYYPYWHGTMERLRENLNGCAARYDKDIYLVETSYPFTAEHYDPGSGTASLCIAAGCCEDGRPSPYPLTPEGQAGFIRDLLELVRGLDGGRGKALYWWEPGWIPAGGTSWASGAALEYCSEGEKTTGNEWSNQCLFDYDGNALPALKLIGDYAKGFNGARHR